MIEQILIAVTTVPAVFLTQSNSAALRKWACIAGLAGEPFWFYSSWQTSSWGIFVTAIAVTLCWAMGVKTYWMTK